MEKMGVDEPNKKKKVLKILEKNIFKFLIMNIIVLLIMEDLLVI